MTTIEILTEQAKNYSDEHLMFMLEQATDEDEVRVLEQEIEFRTSPFSAKNASTTQRSFLADLLDRNI